MVFFALETAAFWLLAGTRDAMLFQMLVFLIISCYGGGFSCMPAYLSDIFGTKELSAIHGRVLTAWGMAGVVGPTIVAWFWEHTHSYADTLYFFGACFVLNLLLATVLKFHGNTAAVPVQTPQVHKSY
jgi:OFA family oxalate/formate antiporter-like MFS transporter